MRSRPPSPLPPIQSPPTPQAPGVVSNTGDVEGGHLIAPGIIRAAKSWWVLMARLAGWNPDGGGSSTPAAPRNLRVIGND